jgi:hypothetical protein
MLMGERFTFHHVDGWDACGLLDTWIRALFAGHVGELLTC